jgi:hypothetical protein
MAENCTAIWRQAHRRSPVIIAQEHSRSVALHEEASYPSIFLLNGATSSVLRGLLPMFSELAQNCNVQRSKAAQNDIYASYKLRRVIRFDGNKRERDS